MRQYVCKTCQTTSTYRVYVTAFNTLEPICITCGTFALIA
jgi:hypothetical protein